MDTKNTILSDKESSFLSPQEEVDLITKAKANDPKARNRLIRAYSLFIWKTIWGVLNSRGIGAKDIYYYERYNLDELFNEGIFGFISGIKGFNLKEGFGLSTYTKPWIEWTVKRVLNFDNKYEALSEEYGFEPTNNVNDSILGFEYLSEIIKDINECEKEGYLHYLGSCDFSINNYNMYAPKEYWTDKYLGNNPKLRILFNAMKPSDEIRNILYKWCIKKYNIDLRELQFIFIRFFMNTSHELITQDIISKVKYRSWDKVRKEYERILRKKMKELSNTINNTNSAKVNITDDIEAFQTYKDEVNEIKEWHKRRDEHIKMTRKIFKGPPSKPISGLIFDIANCVHKTANKFPFRDIGILLSSINGKIMPPDDVKDCYNRQVLQKRKMDLFIKNNPQFREKLYNQLMFMYKKKYYPDGPPQKVE